MVASTDLFPGQWQPQVVLMASLQVGLIEALLDEPRPPLEVAQKLALDERATLRVISVLVDAGYLEKRGDGVMVAPEVRALLDPADESFVGDRLRHLHDLLVRWLQLPDVLRDSSGSATFGMDPPDAGGGPGISLGRAEFMCNPRFRRPEVADRPNGRRCLNIAA